MNVPNGLRVWQLAVTWRGPDSARIGVSGVTSTDLNLPGQGKRFLSLSVQKGSIRKESSL